MTYPPIIAPMMKSREAGWLVIVLPVIFLLLNITDVFVWKCPFFTYTGLKCGGCGMTRGAIAASQGDLYAAINFHPFSILFVAGWLLWTATFCLPEKKRTAIITYIQYLESKTGVTVILILLFLCFGLVRLIFQIY